MKTFIKSSEVTRARAKDSVLRYLYAYRKSNFDGKQTISAFRNDPLFEHKNPDLETAIRSAKKDANYDYCKEIIADLYRFDYIRKNAAVKDKDLTYYSISDAGKETFKAGGFERELRADVSIASENLYKVLGVIIAIASIITPIIYDQLSKGNKEEIDHLQSSVDSLKDELKEIRIPKVAEAVEVKDSAETK